MILGLKMFLSVVIPLHFWVFIMDVDINVIEEMHGNSYSKNFDEIVKRMYVKQCQQHCHYV